MKLPAPAVRSVAAIVATMMFASCTVQPVRVVAPKSQTPVASTPQNAVKLFDYAVNNRDLSVLAGLFTEDFEFVGAGMDSAGNPSREVLGGRDWILAKFGCLFEGGGADSVPPASSVRLNTDHFLVPQADTRPGYHDADSLYKTIRTSVDMTVDFGDGNAVEVTGYALFFLVRGDAAAIPAELMGRGVTHDKSRWWISRWEDETIGWEGKVPRATDPTRNITFARVLEAYPCP